MKKVLLGLALVLMSATLALAQRTVTGMVKDDQGQPLIGATVLVKGSASGAVTDINGNFSVKVPDDNAVLVVSYTGYSNMELAVGSQSVVEISMKETLILQEAVVTAFGIKKNKENLGYAVTEINSKDLTTARVTNVTNALAAKAPGVRLAGSGGSFTGSSIIIRGFTTFTGSNQPLFVVDGIPIDNGGGGSPLQNGPSVSNRAIDLNAEDIENISVLKGAAATALYGSRAASGVILITTKQGKVKQKNSISYTANVAFQEVNRFPDYQNTYGQGTGGAFNTNAISSWGPRIAGQRVALPASFKSVGLDSVAMTAYPNNVEELYQRGINTQHNLAFQGGTDKSAYRLSLGYLDDEGVIKNNRLKRYNASVNASSNITEKLTAGIAANYALNSSDRTQQGNQGSNPVFRSWFTPRSWDLTNLPYTSPTGSQLHYDAAFDNPRWAIDNVLYDDQIDRFIGNFNLGYQLNSWLRADYKVGLDYFIFNRRGYDQIGLLGGGNTSSQGIGGILEGRNINRNINSYLTLSGRRNAGQDLEFNYILGQETVKEYSNNQQLIGRGLVVRNYRNLNSNTTAFFPTYNISERRLIGVFGNLTTIYKNWATLDLSVRNDWNSTLRKGNNSYIYYSVAGTLNVTQMVPSLKSDILPLFKIRANYGRVGRSELRYSTDTYFGQFNPADGFGPVISFPFNSLPGFSLNNTAGNPDLGPEFTTSWEVGTDLSIWKDFLSLELTYYQQKSTDIILAVPNSPAAGIAEVVLNAGSMTTKGWEAGLTITPIKTKNFEWATTFNFTQFNSVVDELAPGVANIFLGGFVTPNIRLVVGEEYGQLYGNAYQRDGNGQLLLSPTGFPLPTANVQNIGNPNPDWTLGINNNISFKGLSLNVLLDYRKGGAQYSRNIADIQRNGVGIETAEKERLNSDGTVAKPYKFEGVFASGTNAGKPNAGAEEVLLTAEQYWGNSGKYVAAEGFVYGTTWFRVREAALNYSVPKRMLEKTPFGSLQLGVFGRNLFLNAPDYPHLDPEQNALGISNAQGLEFNALPQARSYGVNLSVSF